MRLDFILGNEGCNKVRQLVCCSAALMTFVYNIPEVILATTFELMRNGRRPIGTDWEWPHICPRTPLLGPPLLLHCYTR